MNIIIIDFDEKYKDNRPPKGSIVITNSYSIDWVYSCYMENKRWSNIYKEFEASLVELKKTNYSLIEKEMFWFKNFFFPLGQFFLTIEKVIEENNIGKNAEIIFTSFSSN